MQITRILAIMMCFASGATVPLATMADQQVAPTRSAMTFHTSSRNPVFQASVTGQEQEELRVRLWALTSKSETATCADAALTCVDALASEQPR